MAKDSKKSSSKSERKTDRLIPSKQSDAKLRGAAESAKALVDHINQEK